MSRHSTRDQRLITRHGLELPKKTKRRKRQDAKPPEQPSQAYVITAVIREALTEAPSKFIIAPITDVVGSSTAIGVQATQSGLGDNLVVASEPKTYRPTPAESCDYFNHRARNLANCSEMRTVSFILRL